MKVRFNDLQSIFAHGYDDIIDVRSPSEFALDHVPGAINLPVLDDEQRALVGTTYVQDSPFKARIIGGAMVAENAARHLQTALGQKSGGWRPLVYCWRGGQRSGSFASILEQIGWRVGLIEGGYQSYRRLVVAAVHDADLAHRFVLIDGNTGTAKTEILNFVGALGHQVLDLEGLARHRGSVFGGRAGGQPSQRAFEGALAEKLIQFDPKKPILVEAESSRIGALNIPRSIWGAMKDAPRLEIVAPREARARYLVSAYRDAIEDRERLENILTGLIPLQGHDRVGNWLTLARSDDHEQLAGELMLHHYDPRYARTRAKRKASDTLIQVEGLGTKDIEEAASKIAQRLS